jgi:hypothetical protein
VDIYWKWKKDFVFLPRKRKKKKWMERIFVNPMNIFASKLEYLAVGKEIE